LLLGVRRRRRRRRRRHRFLNFISRSFSRATGAIAYGSRPAMVAGVCCCCAEAGEDDDTDTGERRSASRSSLWRSARAASSWSFRRYESADPGRAPCSTDRRQCTPIGQPAATCRSREAPHLPQSRKLHLLPNPDDSACSDRVLPHFEQILR
jgi:hypothetical protein